MISRYHEEVKVVLLTKTGGAIFDPLRTKTKVPRTAPMKGDGVLLPWEKGRQLPLNLKECNVPRNKSKKSTP